MNSTIMLLLIVGMATIGSSETVNFGCPPEWYAYNNFCYKYNLAMEFTEQQAKEHCEGVGAQLLYLTSPEEFMFARAISSRRNPSITSAQTWIGLDDKEKEGTFTWNTGDILKDSLAFWEPNQPNGGRGQNCVTFLIEISSFNDAPCGHKKGVFCKKAAQ